MSQKVLLKMSTTRTNLWCFTWNNYTDRDFRWMKCLDCTWLVMGLELCPTTGTPHIQGAVYWKNGRSLRTLLKLGPIHWTRCDGTALQNRTYCSKECTEFFEKGEMPKGQGYRTDVAETRNRVIAGERVDDILMEDPEHVHQYGRTLDRIEDVVMRTKFRTEMTKGLWLHGPTGVGKSHRVFENFSPTTHYVWPNDGKWWDGYRQQETVIFNDFRGELPYAFLLQMVDKWPFSVPRRNREPMPFLSKRVVFTSSVPPEVVYHNRESEDHIAQLLRRVDVEELYDTNT